MYAALADGSEREAADDAEHHDEDADHRHNRDSGLTGARVHHGRYSSGGRYDYARGRTGVLGP